jgi:hypothetical protein
MENKCGLMNSIAQVTVEKNRELDYLMEEKYLGLFTNMPYEKVDKSKDFAKSFS